MPATPHAATDRTQGVGDRQIDRQVNRKDVRARPDKDGPGYVDQDSQQGHRHRSRLTVEPKQTTQQQEHDQLGDHAAADYREHR